MSQFWTHLRQILTYFILFILGFGFMMLPDIVGLYYDEGLITQATLPPILIGVLILVTGFAWLLYRHYMKKSQQDRLPMRRRDILIVFGWAFALICLDMVFSNLMAYVYGTTETVNDQAILAATIDSPPLLFWAQIYTIAILGPIYEELLMRGLFSQYLLKGRWIYQMILSSLLFASLHLSNNPISFFIYFYSGILLFLAFKRRNNLMDSILFHQLNNAISCIGLMVLYYQ